MIERECEKVVINCLYVFWIGGYKVWMEIDNFIKIGFIEKN